MFCDRRSLDDRNMGVDLLWQRAIDNARKDGLRAIFFPSPEILTVYPEHTRRLLAQSGIIDVDVAPPPEKQGQDFHSHSYYGFDDTFAFLDSITVGNPRCRDVAEAFASELDTLSLTLLNKFSEDVFVVCLTGEGNEELIGFQACIYSPSNKSATLLLNLVAPQYQNRHLQHVIFSKVAIILRKLNIQVVHADTSSDFDHGFEALVALGFHLRSYRTYHHNGGWHASFAKRIDRP